MIDYISKAGALSFILRNDTAQNNLMTKEEHQDVQAIFTMKNTDDVGEVIILTSRKIIIIDSLRTRNNSWVEKTRLQNVISFKKGIRRVVEDQVPFCEVTEVILTIAGRQPMIIKRPEEINCVSYECWKDYEDFVKKLEELID